MEDGWLTRATRLSQRTVLRSELKKCFCYDAKSTSAEKLEAKKATSPRATKDL